MLVAQDKYDIDEIIESRKLRKEERWRQRRKANYEKNKEEVLEKRSEHYEKNKVLILANKNGSYKSNKKRFY